MRTIAGLFDTSRGAQQAVEALRDMGFGDDSINVVSRDSELQDQLGGGPSFGGAAGDRAADTPAGTAPIFAASTGGTVLGPEAPGGSDDPVQSDESESLSELGLSEDEARYYVEAIKHGGVLVTVAVEAARAGAVEQIFRRASAVNFQREQER